MTNRIQRDYSQMIHLMKYAKALPNGGREDWGASVERLVKWLDKGLPTEAQEFLWGPVFDQLKYQRVMPSMRLLSSAGPAADRENLAAFNCMFLGIDSLEAFGRLMYALMCGTGVGFSVEKIYLDKLPPLPHRLTPVDDTIRVHDTRISWAMATIRYLEYLFEGQIPTIDYSLIRPKGAPLVTTGGYASGPEPLEELHKFILDRVNYIDGNHLSSVGVYDICCKIADVVVQGGVRRSATICLFDWNDVDMLLSKKPEVATKHPWRYNSNNTAVFSSEEDARAMLPLILNLAKHSGEPGILLKSALQRRMKDSLRIPMETIGLNPCGEVILRANQVCNLTEVVLNPLSTLEDNMDQVEAAVFLGLLQSQLTNFELPLLAELKANTEEEGLLGVSLTGLMDDEELLRGPHGLAWLKEYAHECAAEWSDILGIKCPTAITCVKPSGTVSKLVGCAPGIHPQFSQYYLSNIAVPIGTPMARFLEDQGVPVRHRDNANVVFSFPMAAPAGALTADKLTSLEHLRLWDMVNSSWCDHNASCTIYVGEDEWPQVQEWCSENIERIAGVTFLSRFDDIGTAYMPLEKITQEDYNVASVEFPVIDWSAYPRYDDHRDTSSQELACTGGTCVLNL